MIIDTDTFVITKENLTPLLRKQICNLKGASDNIVADDLYKLLDNNNMNEVKLRLEQLKEIWGVLDPELMSIGAIVKMIESWR